MGWPTKICHPCSIYLSSLQHWANNLKTSVLPRALKMSSTCLQTLRATCMRTLETGVCTKMSCLLQFLPLRPSLTTNCLIKGLSGDHQPTLRSVNRTQSRMRAPVWYIKHICWYHNSAAELFVCKDRWCSVCNSNWDAFIFTQGAERVREFVDVRQPQRDSDLPFELRGELV